MTQLVSLEAAKAFLQAFPDSGSADETRLADAIARASAICERKLGRAILLDRREHERHRGSIHPKLYPRVWPVNAGDTTTVIVNGVEQTVWRRETDGDPEDFEVQLLADGPDGPNHFWRSCGWAPTSARNPQNVVLTYTGGWAETPDHFREACLLVIQKLWRDENRNLADVAAVTAPSGSITMLDSFLPRRAREILESERAVVVG